MRFSRTVRYVLPALLVAATTAVCSAQDAAPADAPHIIPFEYLDHIFIPVEIGDGVAATLLYDPVRGIYLDHRFVRAHDLRVVGGAEAGYGGPVYAGGAGGAQHLVTFVRDLHVRFGGMSRSFPLAPVIPLDSMMAGSLGRSVDGLFGATVLNDYVVEMDFDASQFVLHDPSGFEPPDGAVVVPIRWTEQTQRPTVPVTLHLADGDAVEGHFILDFGMGGAFRATTGFTNEHRLTELITPGVTSNREMGLGGALESILVHPPGLSIGELRVEQPLLSLARETEGADAFPTSHDGLIGLGFLDRYRVFYDAPGDRIVLAENS